MQHTNFCWKDKLLLDVTAVTLHSENISKYFTSCFCDILSQVQTEMTLWDSFNCSNEYVSASQKHISFTYKTNISCLRANDRISIPNK